MTLLYDDDCFLQHETGAHPECAERLRRTRVRLAESGLMQRCHVNPAVVADTADILLVHSDSHVDAVRQFAEQGGGRIEADTIVSRNSYDVARRAAGSACDAVRKVVAGEDRSALCLVRPPGHHAVTRAPMGFCLFNNVAIAARVAIDQLDLNRVLIVDWDVHHGNGTQDAFWRDEQVAFLSIHRWPFYPGTGDQDETGSGPGLGTTCNLPISYGTSRDEYFTVFRDALTQMADQVKPELVLISAGFDAHRLDPVGSLGLDVEDFQQLTRLVLDVSQTHCRGRVVSLLEGGYNVDILPLCVEAHLAELLEHQA
jgi:acetoin utilization deacetylase AcuC-like enzyme